jgi:hypothetical protein
LWLFKQTDEQTYFIFLRRIGGKITEPLALFVFLLEGNLFYENLLARVQGRSKTSHFVLLVAGRTHGPEVNSSVENAAAACVI